MLIGIVGGTGFIGSACVRRLGGSWDVRAIPAPRFSTTARDRVGLRREVSEAEVRRFADKQLPGVDIMVNAAGLATANSSNLPAMLGANAVLPLFLARAGRAAGVGRMVHVSSAAVQGRRILDESEVLAPENHYAVSKALGEQLLCTEDGLEIIRYRPTSVHGPERSLTRSLVRLAGSPMASAAAPGDAPSPQIPAYRVAEAVGILADPAQHPPAVVLHPWEGATTRSVLKDLGGKEPRLVSRAGANATISAAYAGATVSRRLAGHARRLEMMLVGQAQVDGWLHDSLAPLDSDWLSNLGARMREQEGRQR